MKKGFNILLIVCAALLTLSCSKTKSYTDMLKAEKKAINRLIAEEGIEVLKDFPKDTLFGENQFVLLDNGVYMNIVDRGNDERAVLNKTVILSRFTADFFTEDSVVVSNYGPNSNGTPPVEFVYGSAQATGTPMTYDESILFSLVSEGMQVGLQYVGHKGKVKLIVPFKVGRYDDQNAGRPVYYEILEYKFENSL